MSRSTAFLGATAAIVVAIHLLSRACGWDVHTSAVSGMPVSAWSWFLGPFHMVSYVAAVVVAPILAFASVAEAIAMHALRRESP